MLKFIKVSICVKSSWFMLNLQFVIFFCLAFFSDYLIRKNFFGNQIKMYYFKFLEWSYSSKFIFIFLILFSIFTCLSYLGFNLISLNPSLSWELDFNSYMLGDNNSSNSNVINTSIEDNTVNINNPNVNLNVSSSSAKAINNLAGVLSATGGATLGYNVAKSIPGSPAVKLGLGLGTMGAVQATGLVIGKYLNSQSTSTISKDNKLINDIVTNGIAENKFDEYPLNLLPELNTLINVEMIVMSVIFNLFLANFISNIDFNKYISNESKLGKICHILIKRYIRIWNKTSKGLMIYSWVLLFFCILVTKVIMSLIIQT